MSEPFSEARKIVHACGILPTQDYYGGPGHAIEYVLVSDDGRAWTGNSEYVTEILFCPFCGKKLAQD